MLRIYEILEFVFIAHKMMPIVHFVSQMRSRVENLTALVNSGQGRRSKVKVVLLQYRLWFF